ncbi:hypothetical protein EYZ11_001511 [Aspergillus tanneri]|uniref:Uncharacterized protein n=1 Tax=Aspergillus tanneri TaxID=1220188 RepID=A0A4S3JUH4_9EURO|nr:hypothetical protein EYZ11_001511 [Aspergillus tanneri]
MEVTSATEDYIGIVRTRNGHGVV